MSLHPARRRAFPPLRDGVKKWPGFADRPAGDRRQQVHRGKIPDLEDFCVHWAEGLSASEFEEQLRWFVRDVMPAFQH